MFTFKAQILIFMRRILTLTICLFVFGTVSAQKKKEARPNISVVPQKPGVYHKSAVGGYFTDARKHPIKGMQLFLYLPDSTIGASGFTDDAGYYETNNILPGFYTMKIVNPNWRTSLTITGVPVVRETITEISFFKFADAPYNDTLFAYSAIEPKPMVADKKKK